MKLAYKLTIITTITSFISILVISFTAFSFIRGELETSIGTQQLELAKQTLDKIDRVINERYGDMQTIAGDRQIENFLSQSPGSKIQDISELKRRVEELSTVSGPWENISLVDKNGQIAFSLLDANKSFLLTNKNTEVTDLYHKALKGETAYSDVYYDTELKKITMAFSTPVRDHTLPGRPIVGVAISYLAWPVIMEVLQSTQGTLVNLYNNQGFEIGNKDSNFQSLLKQDNNNKIIQHIVNQQEGSEVSLSVDKQYQSLSSYTNEKGFLNYKGNRWFLLIETPISAAFTPAIRAATRISLLLSPIIIILNGLLILFILRLIKPIEKLTETVKQITAGELSKRVTVASKDEIGELGVAFNRMSDKLQESYRGLEQKVQEKTAALRTQIDETESMNKLMIGRELKMAELKKENIQLKEQLAKV
ncbi:MAG TPA: HAMP domain-containing protein [Candidatus Saccharimonadales bacterium]|nr:HAMP domain-containing protein [Candidatus Saccharimonadales bacterium]